MQTYWTPTNEYYRRILAQADGSERRKLYLDLLVEPWRTMMEMMRGMPGAQPSEPADPLDGARAWNWLLPDKPEEMAVLLEKLEAADAWRLGQAALERAASRFAPYAAQIPFNTITGWLVLGDPALSDPQARGYTGAIDWTQPRFIGQFWDPNPDNLPRLQGLVAHEMHHKIRMSAFPFGMGTSVADYIIIEGTAEAFAASLFGKDKVTHYVSEFDPDAFETARRLIGQSLDATGFNVIRGYIFGDALAETWGFQAVGGMPAYGGYAIGYHAVQAFLERTGRTIEEATFLPAQQIIQESGFFA